MRLSPPRCLQETNCTVFNNPVTDVHLASNRSSVFALALYEMLSFSSFLKGGFEVVRPKMTIILFRKILHAMKFHTKCYEVNKTILKIALAAWKDTSACWGDSCKVEAKFDLIQILYYKTKHF